MRQLAVPVLLGLAVLAVLGALVVVNVVDGRDETPPPVARTIEPVAPAPQTFQVPVTEAGRRDAISGNRDRYLQVGVDIMPGLYQSAGPFQGALECRWERTKRDQDEILASKSSTGPVTVQVEETDGYFHTTGCKPWRRALQR
jgi:hypothetical protein